MRLLLDTHVAVWIALSPGTLSVKERRTVEQAELPLVLSAVSVWELRLKWSSFHVSGSRKGPVGPADIVDFARALDWELLALTARHAAASLAHGIGHKDPFDELLLVQAQTEGLRLLTRDGKLADHPLAV